MPNRWQSPAAAAPMPYRKIRRPPQRSHRPLPAAVPPSQGPAGTGCHAQNGCRQYTSDYTVFFHVSVRLLSCAFYAILSPLYAVLRSMYLATDTHGISPCTISTRFPHRCRVVPGRPVHGVVAPKCLADGKRSRKTLPETAPIHALRPARGDSNNR